MPLLLTNVMNVVPFENTCIISDTINKTSLLHHTYYETRKQAIALLPTLSEKQGATYVFFFNTEVMIANNITSYALLKYDVSDRFINII